ncbi:hypothetical protein ACLK1Z_15410 [Escherichia coli]
MIGDDIAHARKAMLQALLCTLALSHWRICSKWGRWITAFVY